MTRPFLPAVLAAATALTPLALAQQAQFVAIPGLAAQPGTNPWFCGLSGTAGWSGVRVSADGSTVGTVGYLPGFTDGAVPSRALRWRPDTGSVAISPVLTGNYGVVGLAADGRTVFGEHWRWTTNGGYQDLRPQLGNGFFQTRVLFACAWDGVTLAGIEGLYPGPGDMFRWQIGVGAPTPLPRSTGFADGYFYFNTISGDGQVLAGSARRIDPNGGAAALAAVLLGPNGPQLLTGESGQEGVTSLSVDGSVAVGYTTQGIALRAFRWEAGNLVLLDQNFANGDGSYARATNFDGSVIVGDYLVFGEPGTRAFLWTQSLGFVDLRAELSENRGLAPQLAGWQLLTATDVSLDGRTIVGQGIDPSGCERAFLVRLPTIPAQVSSYGSACAGPGGLLQTSAADDPYVGRDLPLLCTGVSAGGTVLAALGTAPANVPLVAVLPQAIPGCTLLVDPVLAVPMPLAADGARLSIVVPGTPALVGAVFHHQAVQLAADASGAPRATSSNGLRFVIGVL